MNVHELAKTCGFTYLSGENVADREVQGAYCCDLLSWVMAHGAAGMAWVTVQTHMNVIAVATLHEMSCVIIPEGAQMVDINQMNELPFPTAVKKAVEEARKLLGGDHV